MNFSDDDYQPKSVGKMADFDTLTVYKCIFLNSSQIYTYIFAKTESQGIF